MRKHSITINGPEQGVSAEQQGLYLAALWVRDEKGDVGFVHSYIFEKVKKSDVLATTKYGKNFPSVVNKGNIYGVQFHPEKSHKNGLKLIKNFILNT